MENLTWGIIVISICSLGYYFSFKEFSKNNVRFALLILTLCGLILRFYTSLDFFLHGWDERFHALVAKNLIDNPLKPMLYVDPVLNYDYKDWTSNHVWVHKQPFPLWTIALSLKFFGINEIALRLPSILLSTIGILITYKIGKLLLNNKVGFFAAFLFSINGLIIELTAGRTSTDHVDIFFMFFISLSILFAIYFASKKLIIYNILCGISIGIAILCKWLPALIVLPIWLILMFDSGNFNKKQISLYFIFLCSLILLVALPWQVYIHHTYPLEATWESLYNFLHLTNTIEGHGHPFYYHIDKIRISYGEIIYIPLIWFIYKTFTKHKKTSLKEYSILIWFLIPLLFFSIAKTKMQAYTLFTSPAIFIISADFWVFLKNNLEKNRIKWLNILLLILLIVLPIRYSIERIKPFQKRDRNPEWAKKLKELKITNEKTILFNVEYPIEAMFYNNCIAYKKTPSSDEIKSLEEKGYTIIVLE